MPTAKEQVRKMKMMTVLLVVAVFFALLPANLSNAAPGQAAEQAEEDLSGKLSAGIQSFEHISGGARGGSFGGGRGGSSRGGSFGSSGIPRSGLPRSGRGINPLYLGTGAQKHNTPTHHSAASKRHSSWLGTHHGLEILLIFTYLAI